MSLDPWNIFIWTWDLFLPHNDIRKNTCHMFILWKINPRSWKELVTMLKRLYLKILIKSLFFINLIFIYWIYYFKPPFIHLSSFFYTHSHICSFNTYNHSEVDMSSYNLSQKMRSSGKEKRKVLLINPRQQV